MNVLIHDVGKWYIRVRPDQYDELITDLAINSTDTIYECNLSYCRLCKSGICYICFDDYELVGGSCNPCIYPNIIVWGVC